LHALRYAHRKAKWLVAIVGCSVVPPLTAPAISSAEEANPNNYSCLGGVADGAPEVGSDEQQVKYAFYCNGPITGFQLQAQVPFTGVQSPPLVTATGTLPGAPTGAALTDTFSCSGDIPGYAENCVGSTKAGYETVTGQFAIGSKLCEEPRVDPLLTVTYAYLEKGAIVQAISGPYDLGRPAGCPPNANSGFNRLNPKPVAGATTGKAKGKKDRKAGGKKVGAKKKAAPKKK
jgi:hypothetical protein